VENKLLVPMVREYEKQLKETNLQNV